MRLKTLRSGWLLLALACAPLTNLQAQTWSRSFGDGDRTEFQALVPYHGLGQVGVGTVRDVRTNELEGLIYFLDERGEMTMNQKIGHWELDAWLQDLVLLDHDALAVGGWGQRPWIVRFDATDGSVDRDYRTLVHQSGAFETVQATLDGGAIACGWVRTDDGDNDMLVCRLDSDGDVVWQKSIGTSAGEMGHAVVPLPNGDFVCLGTDFSEPLTSRLLAVKLDSQGRVRLARSMTPGRRSLGRIRADLTAEGDVIAAFGSNGTFVVRLGSDLAPTWARSYSNNGASAQDLLPTSDGGCLVVADADSFSSEDGWAFKIDRDGNIEWQYAYGSAGVDRFSSIARLPWGALVIAGWTESYTFGEANGWSMRMTSEGRIDDSCLHVRETFATPGPVSFTPNISNVVSSTNLDPRDTESPPEDHTMTPITQCENLCRARFEAYGSGTPGSDGITPRMVSGSGYCAGDRLSLGIEQGLGGTVGILWMSTAPADIPFFGGRLLVDPTAPSLMPLIELWGSGPGGGWLSLAVQEDFSRYEGLTFYFQTLLLDPGAPQGVSMTAALEFQLGS